MRVAVALDVVVVAVAVVVVDFGCIAGAKFKWLLVRGCQIQMVVVVVEVAVVATLQFVACGVWDGC